jgi:hypothetical protein
MRPKSPAAGAVRSVLSIGVCGLAARPASPCLMADLNAYIHRLPGTVSVPVPTLSVKPLAPVVSMTDDCVRGKRPVMLSSPERGADHRERAGAAARLGLEPRRRGAVDGPGGGSGAGALGAPGAPAADRVRRAGGEALPHGQRGRAPAPTVPAAVRQQVVALARAKYVGFPPQHVTEQHAAAEQRVLGRLTVRRMLRAAGLGSPRQRRAPQHRQRRERRSPAGRQLQGDGSRPRGLGPDGP